MAAVARHLREVPQSQTYYDKNLASKLLAMASPSSYPIPGPSSGSSVVENATLRTATRLRSAHKKTLEPILPGCSSYAKNSRVLEAKSLVSRT